MTDDRVPPVPLYAVWIRFGDGTTGRFRAGLMYGPAMELANARNDRAKARERSVRYSVVPEGQRP